MLVQYGRHPGPQRHVGDENGSPSGGAVSTGSPSHAVAAAAHAGKQRRPGVRDLANFMSNPSPHNARASSGTGARGGGGADAGARAPPVPLQGYGQVQAQPSVQSGYSALHGQPSYGSAQHPSPGYSDGSGTFGYGSPAGQYSSYGEAGGYVGALRDTGQHLLPACSPFPCHAPQVRCGKCTELGRKHATAPPAASGERR